MSESVNLASMKLVELKSLAGSLGIKGTSAMRKGDLVNAIQASSGQKQAPAAAAERPRRRAERPQGDAAQAAPAQDSLVKDTPAKEERPARAERPAEERAPKADAEPRAERPQGQPAQEGQGETSSRSRRRRSRDRERGTQQETNNEVGDLLDAAMGTQGVMPPTKPVQQPEPMGYDDGEGRRGRRRRNRDRGNRRAGRGTQGLERMEVEPVVSEDDVLATISGIVDILDNYAFVRTTGYLPGPSDAYVAMSTVRRYGLRRGDVITGAIRSPKDGERKEKFNPLVRLDSVNGDDPEKAKGRPEFAKLTPLYPQERLRIETVQNQITGRIIDLVAPIGKGQRGLIVSPPKAGKTMVMQAISNAIAANHPEVHLMVVLVDERPEEVTDFQRTVSGEVIASTFDRPAEDHTMISELAIERAKRLVELGHDVVVLLDGITRLGRAYNLAAPASGRILSGGVDSAALYPPKKFFGAARNIEHGGSLTILATALIETGSKMDEVIFEEFKGTGNMELRLRRELADKRIFPAIDVDASSTRREDLLLGRDELNIIWKLRRALSGLDDQAALETLKSRMAKTANNHDFLLSVLKTTPAQEG
ncbi:MAG: transcription termination factor Rho [Arachnia sp.]